MLMDIKYINRIYTQYCQIIVTSTLKNWMTFEDSMLH